MLEQRGLSYFKHIAESNK